MIVWPTMPASAPSPAFLDAAPPVSLTAFIGREAEVATVTALLATSRLLTLTGAGGSGKTRLALEVARRWQAERSSTVVAWIELAGVEDPTDLLPHVSIALGVRAEGGGTALRAITAVLQERDVLLVLDNCEHLVDACASFVDRLLQAAPRLRALATSREALGVGGERSWLVPTLELPPADCLDPDAAMTASSVRLFVERARDVSPAFALTSKNVAAVVQVCRRLDGLPLALELAAARVGLLTPGQLAERIGGSLTALGIGTRAAPPRQRTLRAAVAWSYELLDDDERSLLARLSVFVGGFTLEAAEDVAGFGRVPTARVLDVLASLAAKSLIAMQEDEGVARYRLLEMIREFAAERLAESSDAAELGARHARHFRDRLAAQDDAMILARPAVLHETDVEHGNIVAALSWAATQRRADDIGLPLVRSLLWYWYHRQRWREGFAASETMLAAAQAPSAALRAAALHGLGLFGLHQMHPKSDEWLAEAERLWAESGDERWLAFSLLVRVVAASIRGDVDAAERHATRMLALAERQPDPWDAALAKAHAMVPVLNWRGEWSRSLQLLDEAIAAFRARDYPTGVSYALDAQAFVALQLGDLDRAADLAVQSLRNEWDRENRWLAGRNLRILATVAERRGELRHAALLFSITEVWYAQVGASSLAGDRKSVNDLPERLATRLSADEWTEVRREAAVYTCADAMTLAMRGAKVAERAVTQDVAAHATVTEASDASHRLEVRALGRLVVLRDGIPLEEDAWPYAKPRELLLYLLAHPEGRTRDQIGLDFWPDASPAQVKNNFHVTLHHLRKTLGDGQWVRFAKGRYRVEGEALRFDVEEFRQVVSDALRRLRRSPDDADAVARLEGAIALYAGPFGDQAELGDWHVAVRDEVARLYDRVLLALGEAASVEGRHADAAGWFRRLLATDAVHEEAQRLLMLSLARDGRRADALRSFASFGETLDRELQARPSAQLLRLADAIRDGERV